MATTKFELTENQLKTIFDNSFYGTGLLKVRIGKKDINDVDLKSGDVVEVTVCEAKPQLNQSAVKHVGVISMKNTAFCVIQDNGKFEAIINYASCCSILKIGSVN